MHKGKLLPPIYLLACLALAFALHRYMPLVSVIPHRWNLLGLGLIVGGLALIVAPALAFKSRGTAIKPFDESSVLVRDGLYAVTRNPIYLGMVALVLGAAVWLGSAAPFIAPAVLAFILHTRFIRIEEEMLQARFGDEYLAYKARVRRWL